MSMPEIPQEIAFYLSSQDNFIIIFANKEKSGSHCAYYNLNTEVGRAGLAAYCMAIIDGWRFQTVIERSKHVNTKTGEEGPAFEYYLQVDEVWRKWMFKWLKYGNLGLI